MFLVDKINISAFVGDKYRLMVSSMFEYGYSSLVVEYFRYLLLESGT
jgi:hypothetical protein